MIARRAISCAIRLEAEGFRCVLATEGRLGMQMARDERPSLITLDIELPDMDGHAVLHALRSDASTVGIPIVVLSAFGRALPERDWAALAGYLTKPFDVADLVGAVHGALASGAGASRR